MPPLMGVRGEGRYRRCGRAGRHRRGIGATARHTAQRGVEHVSPGVGKCKEDAMSKQECRRWAEGRWTS